MMHKRYLSSSLLRSADALKRTPKYSRSYATPQRLPGGKPAPRTKHPTNDPALNDTLRTPNNPEPVRRTFDSFNVEKLIEQQTRLAGTSSSQTESSPLADNNSLEYATTILDGNEYLPDVSFNPGTFVEIRRSGNVIEGIVLCEIYQRGWALSVLTSNGSMGHFKRTDVHFSIPNFLSSDLAARCGDGMSHPDSTQIHARVQALKQLRVLAVDVEKAVQGSNLWDRQIPLNIYEEVKAKDKTMWGEVSLKTATSLLYLNPKPINYYATHKYLADRPLRYVANDGYFRSQVFFVRPERDVEEILEVDKLIKEYRTSKKEGKYFRFVHRARNVISRWNTDPTLQSGPVSQDSRKLKWDRDDQLFLRFLLRSQQVRRTNQLDPYESGRQTIINDIASPSTISDCSYRDILVKLGIMAPWQEYTSLSPAINPTGDFESSNTLETMASKILQRSQRISGTVLGPFDLHATDPLESVRQDYHGRVFVIDDPSAEELDDGISVERIPSEPNHVWVHVHVADPARYLHPGHALSLRARNQCESWYLVTKSYPLFPSELVYDPAGPMSLTNTKESTGANSAITFSIKLDNTGDMIDYKLQASILRNVRTISYDDVDAALGNDQLTRMRPLGGASRPAATGEPLTDEEIADLQLLSKLTQDQAQQRFKENIVFAFRNQVNVALVNPIPHGIQSPYLRGSRYHGFPELDYTVSPTLITGARAIVAEMMKLAGRAASCVARDKDISLIRRGMEPITFGDGVENLLAARTPDGGVPFNEALKYVVAQPPTTLGVELKAHYLMGIPASDGYSRITSPLRRFADLVGHWQLHHILLGPNAPRRPPFDKADVMKLAQETSLRARDVKILTTSDMKFWSTLALQKFAQVASVDGVATVPHSTESPLSLLHGYIRSEPQWLDFDHFAVVDVPDLGISGFLGGLKGRVVGDNVCVRVKTIELGRFPKVTFELV